MNAWHRVSALYKRAEANPFFQCGIYLEYVRDLWRPPHVLSPSATGAISSHFLLVGFVLM